MLFPIYYIFEISEFLIPSYELFLKLDKLLEFYKFQSERDVL